MDLGGEIFHDAGRWRRNPQHFYSRVGILHPSLLPSPASKIVPVRFPPSEALFSQSRLFQTSFPVRTEILRVSMWVRENVWRLLDESYSDAISLSHRSKYIVKFSLTESMGDKR